MVCGPAYRAGILQSVAWNAPTVETAKRFFGSVDALDPVTGKRDKEVRVTNDRMINHVAKSGAAAAAMARELLPQVLESPSAVFEGLRWDDDQSPSGDGWLCYVGTPKTDFVPEDKRPDARAREVSWRAGFVLLVFLNHDGVAYLWRREKADANDDTMPNGFQSRFRKRIFP